MLDILLGLLELFLEVLFEFAGEALLDLLLRALFSVLENPEFRNPLTASLGYAILGALAGGLSVLVFPHPLVQPSRLHGISLVVSPIVTGAIMSLIGSMLRHRGKKVIQLETFGYGFAFAFGMALVRFIFVR